MSCFAQRRDKKTIDDAAAMERRAIADDVDPSKAAHPRAKVVEMIEE